MAGKVVDTIYGPISAEFTKSSLADLCVPSVGIQTGPFGSQLHASDYVEFGTPIITVEHLGENRIIHSNIPRITDEDKERLSRYSLIAGDIVFSRVGAVDRRAIVHPEEDGWLFSGRCLRVRPDRNKIDPNFLSWFFGLPTFQEHIRQIAVGATMPSLNTKILGDVTIYYPQPLPEQRAIAHILGTLDDKIELNRRMNETLEAMARAIFKSWFVDFDPVRAKARGEQPAGLAPEVAALFPDALVETELGEAPEGWGTGSFLDVADLLSGGTPSTANSAYWNGDIPWVSAKDVSGAKGSFLLNTEKAITQLGVQNSSTKILPAHTTIITARGTVGSYCLLGSDMAMNQTNYGLRAKRDVGDFFVFFSTAQLIEHLQQQAYGTIFDTITTKTFRDTVTVQPPQPLLGEFEAMAEPIMMRVLANEQQSRTLAALRDTLLPKLISGELRVADAERIVGATA